MMKTPSPDPQRRLRVLLVAEAANPNNTSVALIGWSFSRAIAQLTDAHLAFELRNRADIVATGLDPAEFTAIDNRRWQGAAWNIAKVLRGGTTVGWTTYSALAMLAYPFFEQKVWRQFGDQLRHGEFDLVHRVTPLAPVVPSFLAKRCAKIGVPFILGPLNGGVPWPKEFSGARRAEKEWLSYIRGTHKLLPGFHSTRKNSAAILVAARSAWAEMPPQYLPQCVFLPENAIDPNRFPRRPVAPVGPPPLRVAFVGRLVPLKGVDMLVEAAAPLVRDGKLVLDIIGDGPELPRLKQIAADQQITAGVQFPGWVKHDQLADRLGQSQIFGFPSFREFGGGVVLEAMALGLVPIVLNYGGPAELVPPGTGLCLPMAPRAALVQSLQASLTQLSANPAQLQAMGLRAQEYVYRRFTWEAKARQVLEVYRWVLGQRKDKPDFGMPLAF